jgi:hypothetical protein
LDSGRHADETRFLVPVDPTALVLAKKVTHLSVFLKNVEEKTFELSS